MLAAWKVSKAASSSALGSPWPLGLIGSTGIVFLVQSVAPFLPPYHFVQLALGTIGASEGGSPVVHAAAVLAFTVLFLLVASWGYRRDEGRTYG